MKASVKRSREKENKPTDRTNLAAQEYSFCTFYTSRRHHPRLFAVEAEICSLWRYIIISTLKISIQLHVKEGGNEKEIVAEV